MIKWQSLNSFVQCDYCSSRLYSGREIKERTAIGDLMTLAADEGWINASGPYQLCSDECYDKLIDAMED